MVKLLDSISEVGIKVPLSVYSDKNRFVLIDGERRWRCALKLNLKSVPAIVQPKPGQLENILTMFNIHNVRQDWDLLPMAKKLKIVEELLEAQLKKSISASELAAVTGLTVSTVRRAFELLELPQKYQDLLMSEAEKSKDQQVYKADLFVEIYKARNAIRRHTPDVFQEVSEDDFIDLMVEKYAIKVVPSVTSFREISKMARANLAGVDRASVEPVLVQLITTPQMSIADAYAATVEPAYQARELTTRTMSLITRLVQFKDGTELGEELAELLVLLRIEIDRLV